MYYLIHAPVTGNNGFYYSIIDMSQDSGRGAVIQKNVQLQGPTFWANDGITAIKHGNGRDWWVMVRDWQNYNNKFYYYSVTPAGITLDHAQYIGDTVKSSFYRIEASDDGEKVACIANQGLISVFDFDRCGGWLSNEINIEYQNPNTNLIPWYWDCELSPNKRYLYVSQAYSDFDTTNYLLRFDLQAANIPASRDTLYAGEESAVAGLIELAPDGKIYWACAYNPPGTFFYPYPDSTHNYITDNLSVINYPDSSNCDFQRQFQASQEANRTLSLLSIFSLVAIFFLLIKAFGDWRVALQVMINIPLALIGAVWALHLSGGVFSIATLVGFVSLVGITSRNGIMMISHYLHLMKEEGEDFTEHMIVRGSLERLVPVLMTALTAGLSLIPFILAADAPGKEILHPLAVVVLGGILTSTLLDQIVTPAIFYKFGRPSAERVIAERERGVSGSGEWERDRADTVADFPPKNPVPATDG